MVKQITSRANGLAMIISRADFKIKSTVANGAVLSQLCWVNSGVDMRDTCYTHCKFI